MTARQILLTAPPDLVPPSYEGRSKLPQRTHPPKNTVPADAVEGVLRRIRTSKDAIDDRLLADAIRQILKDRWLHPGRNGRWEMHWVLVNSDLIGGLLGIFGSLVLGYPFVTEMTDRHHWDLLRRFKQQQMATTGSSGSSTRPREIEAYREIRDRLIDQRGCPGFC
jgi:hypothetical protein